MPVNPRDYALVVGINDYPGFRPLRGAIQDAKDVEAWLKDTAIGGGVQDHQCGRVVSTPNPLRPIHKDIDDALEALTDLATANGGGRRFYLYFSGHGLGSGPDTALCLAGWSEKHRLEALESPTYTQYLKDTALFEEIVLVMDCCRIKKINARGLPCTLAMATAAVGAGASRQFTAHATEALKPAYEAVVAATTGVNGDEVRGHFTRALLEALYGAAAEAAGGVTATGLKKYLERETPVIANDAGHEQKPEVVDGLPSVTPVIFGSALPIVSVNVTFQFSAARIANVVLEGPDLAEIRNEPAAAVARWTNVPLPPSQYSLRDVASGETKLIRVRPVREAVNVVF
jgi:hypothetical protein